MTWVGRVPPDAWHRRFEAAQADLLDARRMLEVRARLAGGMDPVAFGDLTGLRRAMRVGVFSGSFNPQTVAHVAVAEAARHARRLDMVVWALARTTVDKECVDRASLADRVVQLMAYTRATVHKDAVVVMDGGLYADQAEAIHSLVAQNAEVWLIVGFDKVVQILDARYYTDRDEALRRLFGAAGLLVAPRAGQGETDLAILLAQSANRPFARRIAFLPVAPEIAATTSTEARLLMRSDVTPDQLGALLTPEGAALGLATGAYRDVERLRDGTVVDPYAARNQWLDAVAHER